MKNIVLTGALKDGYGEAIFKKLNNLGYRVLGTYESEYEEKAIKLKLEFPNSELFCVDHSNRESILKFVSKISSLQISGIISAQMFFNMENIDNFDFDLWDKSLMVNISTPNILFHTLKKSLTNPASIIIITSTEGFIGSFGASAYACSKAAIHNLVKTHANIGGRDGIRVNAVAAGWIGGVMDTDEVFNLSRSITPIGRLGSPDEISNIVTFLLSEESSFINGSVITADGGYSGVDTIAKFEFEQENNK